MQRGAPDWTRLWAYPMLLAGIALAFDAADRRVPFSVLASGPLDEVAHLAFAAMGMLVLACLIDLPRRFYAAALIASVAIDLDHIPLYLGLLGNQDQRPVTHSLGTVIIFVAAAVASRRHRVVFAGIVTGLVLHFARDIAEGPPGVRMLWPIQQTAWTASYWWFLGMVIVLTAARLILASCRIPRTPACPFGATPSSRSTSGDPTGCDVRQSHSVSEPERTDRSAAFPSARDSSSTQGSL